MDSLELFSDEILLKILSNLSLFDLLKINQTSSKFHRLFQDELLWKDMVKRDFNFKWKAEETWSEEYQRLTTKEANILLIISAKRGDFSMVKYLINQGSYQYLDYKIALLRAIKYNYLEIFYFLLTEIRENYLEINFSQTLNAACRCGHFDIVISLLNFEKDNPSSDRGKIYNRALGVTSQVKINPNCHSPKDYINITNGIISHMKNEKIPIDYTILLGNLSILLASLPDSKEFQTHREEITQNILQIMDLHADIKYSKVLLMAASGGNLEIIHLILSKILSLRIEIDYEDFLVGAIKGNHQELADRILKWMRENNEPIDYCKVAKVSSAEGQTEMMIKFLNLGKPSNDLLYLAARKGYLKMMMVIIERLREKKKEIIYQWALNGAFESGNPKAVEFIINQAQENEQFLEYNSPLKAAIEKENPSIVKLVLNVMRKNGAQLNYINLVGINNLSIIKLLIKEINNKETLSETDILNNYWASEVAGEQGDWDFIRSIIKRLMITGKFYAIKAIEKLIVTNNLESVLKIASEYNLQLNNWSLLEFAAYGGSIRTIKHILQNLTVDLDGYNRIFSAAVPGRNIKVIKMVLEMFEKHSLVPDYENHIMSAIDHHDMGVTKFLLERMKEKGLEINYSKFLIMAIKSDDVRMVKFLTKFLDEDSLNDISDGYGYIELKYESRMAKFLRDEKNRDHLLIRFIA